MRDIVARLCMSRDGMVERPDSWLPEPGDVIERLAAGAEAVLFGRTTYEQLTGLDHVRKLVIASTPVACRPKTEVLQGEPGRVLRALKQVPGPDLHVIGSVTLVRSLLRWGLLDELSLVVHPVRTGPGVPLVEDRRMLHLISACAGPAGVLEASYQVRYAGTATSSSPADSVGRWGGTWSKDRVATSPRTAISTHA